MSNAWLLFLIRAIPICFFSFLFVFNYISVRIYPVGLAHEQVQAIIAGLIITKKKKPRLICLLIDIILRWWKKSRIKTLLLMPGKPSYISLLALQNEKLVLAPVWYSSLVHKL